jgi:ASC-1-like (ASCH) protein
MKTLTLPLKAIYFNQIKAGTKLLEYRLCTPFWRKRLEGKHYDRIVLTLGYPKSTDNERRLTINRVRWSIKTITHPHFGAEPVRVYAIDVKGAQ